MGKHTCGVGAKKYGEGARDRISISRRREGWEKEVKPRTGEKGVLSRSSPKEGRRTWEGEKRNLSSGRRKK